MPLIGREWLFIDLERSLIKDTASKLKGVILLGEVGTGKTTIVAKLVSLSTLSQFLVNDSSPEIALSGWQPFKSSFVSMCPTRFLLFPL